MSAAKLNEEAVDYAFRAIIDQLDSDLHTELANPEGFSLYPDIVRRFIGTYQDYVE